MGIKHPALSELCLDLLDVCNRFHPAFMFHHRSQHGFSSLAWLLVVVMPLLNLPITSFWSHCQTHPCILWRSKLRNSYCTLCKRLLSSVVIKCKIGRVNILLGRFKNDAFILRKGIAVRFAIKFHSKYLEVEKLFPSKFLE